MKSRGESCRFQKKNHFGMSLEVVATILKMVGNLLDDDKPLRKEWWFGNQPIKNGGWTSRDVSIFFYGGDDVK